MWSFVMYQSGGGVPGSGRVAFPVPGGAMIGNGACPTVQTLQTAAIGTDAAVVDNTTNFFAGLYGNCFMGRDTNGSNMGGMWLCTGSAAGCYSPTYLAGIGFGGNWMIRVTVEDTDCVPVELQSFSVQ
jgi:hypothetical protein